MIRKLLDWKVAVAVLIALAFSARLLLSKSSGIFYAKKQNLAIIPFNQIGFWAFVGLALAISLMKWLTRMRA